MISHSVAAVGCPTRTKIFDFTLLTFITVVLKSKGLKEIFSKFLDSILIPPGHEQL